MKIQVFSTDGLGASFFDVDEALEYAHFQQVSELIATFATGSTIHGNFTPVDPGMPTYLLNHIKKLGWK